jgi:hypothetical protein
MTFGSREERDRRRGLLTMGRWALPGALLLAGCRPEPAAFPLPMAPVAAVATAPPSASWDRGQATGAAIPAPTETTSPQPSDALPLGTERLESGDGEEDAIYAWEDDDGSVHYGNAGDVPPARGGARLVTTRLSLVMEGDGSHPSSGAEAAPASIAAQGPPDEAAPEQPHPPALEATADTDSPSGETFSAGYVLLPSGRFHVHGGPAHLPTHLRSRGPGRGSRPHAGHMTSGRRGR